MTHFVPIPMAAVIAIRRAHSRTLGGASLTGTSDQFRINNTLGGLSFDIPNRSRNLKQETENVKKEKYRAFPNTADIQKDLELDVLVGRKSIH